MELKTPRPKKTRHQPTSFRDLLNGPKYSGYFNDFAVIVSEGVKELHAKGCFGKGALSRSYPSFRSDLVRKRVFEHRKKVGASPTRPQKVIVTPDSDSETEYFTNLRPQYCIDRSSVTESLHLSLEEAYFLSCSLNCLNVYNNDELAPARDLWNLFHTSDKCFGQNYAVYHYFRSKNWVVKPGIKFGGDYLLYKDGPGFHHASYLVIVDILDATSLERKSESCRRSMDVTSISGLNRLCETVGKVNLDQILTVTVKFLYRNYSSANCFGHPSLPIFIPPTCQN
ncbi:hypothetical protein RI129_009313 [Pyrocoelia pectoralis]|uniref:tRNA-intron lyase n=1 Tax=Pyrocoelia pectoralis TaxID=417401 RepID=A0AAN7V896_9COLE